MLALLLVAIVGCTDVAPLPTIVVVSDVAEHASYAAAWEPLGFVVTSSSSGPECPRRWYDEPRDVDCAITITIVVEDNLREREGTDALADRDRRGIRLDTRLDDFALCIAVAHEVGHIVLDTPEHTIGGVMGGADCALHDVDRALACSSIGAC